MSLTRNTDSDFCSRDWLARKRARRFSLSLWRLGTLIRPLLTVILIFRIVTKGWGLRIGDTLARSELGLALGSRQEGENPTLFTGTETQPHRTLLHQQFCNSSQILLPIDTHTQKWLRPIGPPTVRGGYAFKHMSLEHRGECFSGSFTDPERKPQPHNLKFNKLHNIEIILELQLGTY